MRGSPVRRDRDVSLGSQLFDRSGSRLARDRLIIAMHEDLTG